MSLFRSLFTIRFFLGSQAKVSAPAKKFGLVIVYNPRGYNYMYLSWVRKKARVVVSLLEEVIVFV